MRRHPGKAGKARNADARETCEAVLAVCRRVCARNRTALCLHVAAEGAAQCIALTRGSQRIWWCSRLRGGGRNRLGLPVTGLRLRLPVTGLRLRLPVTGLRLPVTGLRLPVTGLRLRLPVTGLRLPVTGLRLPVTGLRLRVVRWRLIGRSVASQTAQHPKRKGQSCKRLQLPFLHDVVSLHQFEAPPKGRPQSRRISAPGRQRPPTAYRPGCPCSSESRLHNRNPPPCERSPWDGSDSEPGPTNRPSSHFCPASFSPEARPTR